jgi:hypothetical protein
VVEHGGVILRHEIDTAELLEELEHHGEGDAVEIAIVAHAEDFGEAGFGHFDDGVFDLQEFLVDLVRLVFRIVQGRKNFQGGGLTAL